MKQKRMGHTCAQVFLDPGTDPSCGIIACDSSIPGAVLSVLVAGGGLLDSEEKIKHISNFRFSHRSVQRFLGLLSSIKYGSLPTVEQQLDGHH